MLAGDLVARATGAPEDGFSKPYVAAVAYGSAVYGFLALVLAILCAQRLGLARFVPAVAVWLGTPLLFYMYVAPPFSHACSAFGVALLTYVWLRVRDEWSVRGMLALGAAGALMAMVREQDVFFAAGPALDLLWALRFGTARDRSVRRLEVGALGGVAAAARLIRGGVHSASGDLSDPQRPLGTARIGRHKMNWTAPHALEVLFSPEHGFFVWTPLALIAIAGLVWAAVARRLRRGASSSACC